MLLRSALPIARSLSGLYKGRPWTPSCYGAMTLLPRAASNYPKPPPGYCPPTMDDLPVPCGDWYTDYVNKQRKYNIQLIFSTGFFLITLFVAIYTNLFSFPASFPVRPGPKPSPSC